MAYIKASVRRSQIVAAARAALARDGVANTTLRTIAAEAQVPLGTLYYIFPTKEQVITAVLEDAQDEVSAVFKAAPTRGGLDHALRGALDSYWKQMIVNDPQQALMRQELYLYALRTPGQQHLARWQIEGYTRIVAEWSQQTASNAGEVCAVPFDTLARALVGGVLGIVMQYLSDHDKARSQRDLHALADMLVSLAAPRPAANKTRG